MLRQIANKVKGRTKSIDESPSLQEVLAILNGLNGNTRGNIYYGDTGSVFALKKVAPRDMADFVRDKFYELEGYYNKMGHQVYSGERDERHYLDLAQGVVEGRFGATVVKRGPFKTASIDFVVEKQK